MNLSIQYIIFFYSILILMKIILYVFFMTLNIFFATQILKLQTMCQT